MAAGRKTGGKNFIKGNKEGLGRPTIPKEIKKIQNLTTAEVETMVTALLKASEADLKEIKEDKSQPFLKRIIVQILHKTYNTGNMTQLDMILNRVIGKVKEKIEHEITRPSILVRQDGSEVVFTNKKIKDD